MSRKKLAWANKEVETFVCILGEEDVVYDVYVAAAAIDIRPTTTGKPRVKALTHTAKDRQDSTQDRLGTRRVPHWRIQVYQRALVQFPAVASPYCLLKLLASSGPMRSGRRPSSSLPCPSPSLPDDAEVSFRLDHSEEMAHYDFDGGRCGRSELDAGLEENVTMAKRRTGINGRRGGQRPLSCFCSAKVIYPAPRVDLMQRCPQWTSAWKGTSARAPVVCGPPGSGPPEGLWIWIGAGRRPLGVYALLVTVVASVKIQRSLARIAKEGSAFIGKMANDSPAKSLVDIDLASLRDPAGYLNWWRWLEWQPMDKYTSCLTAIALRTGSIQLWAP
ncbi:unnamed protein product [Boreogadus saida]